MKTIRKSKLTFFDFVVMLHSIVILIAILYPLYFVVIASFSEPEAVVGGRITFLPVGFSIESYKMILQESRIWLGYRNTILYAFLGTTINLLLTILAAYPLSRRDTPARRFFTVFITFTMLFSGGMIPVYMVVRGLHLTNSIWAMVVPNAINTFNLLVLKNNFESSIPIDLQEAAEIDGSNHFQTLLLIVLPLAKPILAVITLFYFVGHWNAYFNAVIYLRDAKLFPLQIILRDILLQNSLEAVGGDMTGMYEKVMRGETMKYSLIIIATVPVMALYAVLQRYFEKGVMIGAVKG